jgi:O-antigen/teichoic acid export membrane protein
MANVDANGSRPAGSEGWLASIRSVTDGAVLHFAGNLVTNGVTFVLTLLLTNALGGTLYGVYTLGRRIVREIQKFTSLGTDIAITRLLSGNLEDGAYQNRVFFLSYATTTATSLLVGALIFVHAPTISAYTLDSDVFTAALRVFVVSIPFVSLTRLGANSFRGLEMPVHQNVVKVIIPVVRLAVIGAAVLLGYSVIGASTAYVLASVTAFLLVTAVVLARTDLWPSWRGVSRGELAEFYNYSLPLSGSKAGSLLYNQVDVFMVGIFLTATDVGIYSISMLLAGIILMPLSGFNQLFPPVASRLYAADDEEMLQSVFATVTRWTITATLFIALVLVLYRQEILSLFGPSFTDGTAVLALFVFGQAVVALAGPSNDVLTMTDNQYVVMVNHWTFGVLNVALNYVCITAFGLVGAAVATAAVLATLNAVRVAEVWYLEGLFPYTRRLWKPAVAAVGALGVLYAATFFLSGAALVVVGGLAGAAVYAAVLLLLGIEPRDRRLLANYRGILE